MATDFKTLKDLQRAVRTGAIRKPILRIDQEVNDWTPEGHPIIGRIIHTYTDLDGTVLGSWVVSGD